jgi:RNA polymerase sigma factor (sigma-70 family)
MTNVPPVIDALRRWSGPTPAESPDADLLMRFVATGDPAAFEALVRRHGPLVWGACRRRLRDAHAAEDAFQTTFLALARHAASVRRPAALGAWLHRVAVRCAGAVREGPAVMPASIPDTPDPTPGPADVAAGNDLERLIDTEIDALPERLRRAFILCEVEQRTAASAAAVLGCPVGTVESRLTRARQRLRSRLAQKGVTAGALTGLGLAGIAVPATARAAAVAVATGTSPYPAVWATIADKAVKTAFALNATGYVVAIATMALGLGGLIWVLTAPRPTPVVVAQPTGAPAAQRRLPLPEPIEFRRDRNLFPLPPEAIARVGNPWLRHAVTPSSIAFSGDSRYLAVGGPGDQWARVWDIEAGRPRAWFRLTPDENLVALALTKTGRELRAVVHAGNPLVTELREYDAYRSLELSRRQIGDGPTDFAAFAPDGDRLVYAVMGQVRAIDPATGQVAWSAGIQAGESKIELAVSPDRVAVVYPGSESIALFDLATGKPAPPIAAGAVPSVPAFSRDGHFMAVWLPVGKIGGTVRVWDVRNRALVHSQEPRTKSAVDGLALSPDGRELVAFTSLGPSVWSLTKGVGQVFTDAMGGRRGVFSPNGKCLAVANELGTVQLFDARTGRTDPRTPAEVEPPQSLAFDKTGSRLMVEGWMRWSEYPTTGDGPPVTFEPGVGANEPYYSQAGDRAAVSPDRTRMVRCTRIDMVDPVYHLVVIDTATKVELKRIPLPGRVRRPAFSPDGRTVYAVAADRRVHGWDLETGREVMTGQRSAGDLVNRLYVSPDGRYVATAVQVLADIQQPNSIQVWDARTGDVVLAAEAGFRRPYVAFSPDGRWVAATVAADPRQRTNAHELRVWDLTTREQTATFADYDGQPAFSPDGRTLAVTRADHVVLLELATGRERHIFRHHGRVEPVLAWRPDGRVLAVASQEAPVYLWDVAGDRTGTQDWAAGSVADLETDDAPKAFAAVRRIWAHPDKALPYLKERVTKTATVALAARACEALELPATTGGVALLREWAAGPPDAPRTREAKESLRRLDRRGA